MSHATRTTTIRALMLRDGLPVLAAGQPLPALDSGHVLIEPTRCAVSATDVERCRGFSDAAGVLGHQFVGIVRDAHDVADRSMVGKRVVARSIMSCGTCNLCARGLADHCRERTMLGIDSDRGCFADLFVLPAVNCVAVPDQLDDDHAVFAHDVASALQCVHQLTISGKPYITVLGDGTLGMIVAQLMAKQNASVRLVGRYTEKLALCERWGLKHRHADDVGRRADQDIVVDCTGTPTGLELALRLVRPRGTVVLKSIIAPKAVRHFNLASIVTNEISLVGSFGGPMAEAVHVLNRLEVDVVSLIGRRMRLDDGPALLDAAAEPGAMKVLVDP
ncbi:MAG: alcohol dehydrogenase catalytic domain-containing protein [Planctomycetota bacterium]